MKKLLFLLFFINAFNEVNAQPGIGKADKFFLGYEAAFPGGDFISKPSWVGGRAEYRHMIKPNISFGIGMSWNSFEDYVPRTTYQKPDGTGAVTTDLVKDIYTVPITASLHYYFNGGKQITPYVGLGLGTQYSDQNLYFNIFSIGENNWGFVARPEIGLLHPVNDAIGLYLSAAYNYATNKNETLGIDNIPHFAIGIGFVFNAR